MQLTLLVLAATAATANGLAAPVANPGATTSQGGLFAAVAAKNAEMLAVKEGEHRRIKANFVAALSLFCAQASGS